MKQKKKLEKNQQLQDPLEINKKVLVLAERLKKKRMHPKTFINCQQKMIEKKGS